MECLLENIVGMGFLVLEVQASVTETVDIPPCQINLDRTRNGAN